MKGYFNSSNIQQLNFNVFYSRDNLFGCHSNTFGTNCHSNTFSSQCYFNIFGNNCYANSFGATCYYNTFGNNCYSNTFGYAYTSNSFGNTCYSNTFGEFCRNNSFSNYCYSNIFGNNCSSNAFGNYCSANTFGTYCEYNIFGNYCRSTTLGNYCRCNTVGVDCYCIRFGTSASTFIDYVQYITIEPGCRYINLSCAEEGGSTSNYAQNIHIHSGVSGDSYSNPLPIIIPERNLQHEIEYRMAGSEEITIARPIMIDNAALKTSIGSSTKEIVVNNV